MFVMGNGVERFNKDMHSEISDRVISLFQYIKELNKLKQKTILNTESYRWCQWVSELPDDPEHVKIFYQDRVDEDDVVDEDGNILLSVQKQEYTRCPLLPESLSNWVKPGWNEYSKNVEHYDSLAIKTKNENTEEYENVIVDFCADIKRVSDFSSWIIDRDHWAEEQRRIAESNQLFSSLYAEYYALKRESETNELIVANGVFCDANDKAVCHPILTHKCILDFDPEKNIVCIRDTNVVSELYTDVFQGLDGVNLQEINDLRDKIIESDYHPLDRNNTPDFFRILIRKLSSNSLYVGDSVPEHWEQNNRFLLYNAPCFIIRKKLDGTAKAIEKINEAISSGVEIPKTLVDLVKGGKINVPVDDREYTIDEQLAMVGGESVDVLLSKPANREQLEIAQRIENYNAVLVQGPPGTGKTHTIANLLGHFIAQGKSVLVTSHTTKALAVLKDKIEGNLKNLCVSLLDDSNKDMEESVEGITDYMARNTSLSLKKEMDELSGQRQDIIKKLADIRKKIYMNIQKECQSIFYNGEGITPSQAASFVDENRNKLNYIPGKIHPDAALPLSFKELIDLYRSNEVISEEDAVELSYELPSLDEIISAKEFEDICKNIDQLEKKIDKEKALNEIDINLNDVDGSIHLCLQGKDYLITSPNKKNILDLYGYCKNYTDIELWQQKVIIDGNAGGGFRDRWLRLADQIKEVVTLSASVADKGLGLDVSFVDGIFLQDLLEPLRKVKAMYENNGKLPMFFSLRYGACEKAMKSVRIGGRVPSTVDDCQLAIMQIELHMSKNKCKNYWNELLVPYGVADFEQLGVEPERIACKYIDSILHYLDWTRNDYQKFLDLLNIVGFPEMEICNITELDSEADVLEKKLRAVSTLVPEYCNACLDLIKLKDYRSILNNLSNIVTRGNRINSDILQDVNKAIISKDSVLYNDALKRLGAVYEKYDIQYRRNEYLKKLEPYAPEWAEAIRQRIGIHGNSTVPADIMDAWKWGQLSIKIDDMTKVPLSELQAESRKMSRAYREITANYAEKCGWYRLLCRTESDLDLKQALQGWKAVVKKIGKGTGKNAPMYKAEARRLMALCQRAVPAWIMPIYKAMDNLNPAINSFDIVIVDEASQSDISSLAVLYMGKKLIIVGDDKQVSPMAVGVDATMMTNLRDMYLSKDIPNNILYDATTSIYDIAMTTYQPLMLKEHFRCVPDIIGYSNWLSYDGKIMPLRAASDSNLLPAVVNYRVDDGARNGKQKINQSEAKAIVALIRACIEQPEYKNKTIGVISLLGSEQAKLVEALIYADEHISSTEIEERQILCGDASNFQGDERDVIFLSMVDSSEEGDKTLSLKSEGVNNANKKRYNVAVSRARDQLWVVYSLDPAVNLKSGDIRRGLLEYTSNPHSFEREEENVKDKADSPFEVSVAMALKTRGYNIVQQWEVGAYRIDMVAVCKDKKIAIECDGERWHSSEAQIKNDMERQTILERIGWQFIRIRGSEYYSQPDKTIERVVSELEDFGIRPEAVSDFKKVGDEENELLNRVKHRAAVILNPKIESLNLKTDKGDKSANLMADSNQSNETIKIAKTKSRKNDSVIAEMESLFDFKDEKVIRLNKAKENLEGNGYSVIDRTTLKHPEIWVISNKKQVEEIKKLVGKDFLIKYDRGRIQSNNQSFYIIRGDE